MQETLSDSPSLMGDYKQAVSLCFVTVFPYHNNPDLSQKSLYTPKSGLFFQLFQVAEGKIIKVGLSYFSLLQLQHCFW